MLVKIIGNGIKIHGLGKGYKMFKYVKMLEYPINIKKKDLRMARYIVTQYGGAYGKWDYI